MNIIRHSLRDEAEIFACADQRFRERDWVHSTV